jgi:nucleotide-binding universal stress UspA family protein
MYRSILVPLDGSALGEYALPVACDIARRSGATLHLVHAHEDTTPNPIYVEGLPVIDENLLSLGRAHDLAYLEAIRDRLNAMRECPSRITVAVLGKREAEGYTPTLPAVLAAHAVESNSDLIVMTTHGRSGLARYWLGSVADGLVRISPVPLLLLRPDTASPEHTRPIRRMLIPLDGSLRSEAILEHAIALGRLMPAEYTLLRVVAPFVLGLHTPFTPARDDDPAQTARLESEAQHYLETLARGLRASALQVRTQVLIAEQAATAILEQACVNNTDLIAMCPTGRSGLARFLIGSVADKVLRGANVPVLFYRSSAVAGSGT